VAATEATLEAGKATQTTPALTPMACTAQATPTHARSAKATSTQWTGAEETDALKNRSQGWLAPTAEAARHLPLPLATLPAAHLHASAPQVLLPLTDTTTTETWTTCATPGGTKTTPAIWESATLTALATSASPQVKEWTAHLAAEDVEAVADAGAQALQVLHPAGTLTINAAAP